MGIRIVKLPDVGEGVAEAELVEWHVTVGQSVLDLPKGPSHPCCNSRSSPTYPSPL